MRYLVQGSAEVSGIRVDLEIPQIEQVRRFLPVPSAGAWLVGGTVRDLASGIEPIDIDIAIDGDPNGSARDFADSISGSFFQMSEEFKTCRVISSDRLYSYDFAALRAPGIENDLRLRDFTVDAMAVDLRGDGELIDPLGGLEHLRREELVACGPATFADDPLRLMRAVRLAITRHLAITPELEKQIIGNAHRASDPSAERLFSELSPVLEPPRGSAAVRLMDRLGLLQILLPELKALQGVTQNEFHHLDVFEHTLANYQELGRIIENLGAYFPGQRGYLAERRRSMIAGNASWRLMMGLASLFHDVAKPHCRGVDEVGRVHFLDHASLGRDMTSRILSRFKAGNALQQAVSFLVGKHMRFEGLVQQHPPSRRARYRYLRATDPFTPELIILSVSDRLSVLGPLVSERDVELHLELAHEMMGLAMEVEKAEPLPKIIGGDDLMAELGLEPGPEVGRLMDHIREEQALGNVSTREEALEAAMAIRKDGGAGGDNPE